MLSIGDDIGIYIGSAMAYGCTRKRGIVLCEPAMVAVETESGRILNAGFEAEELIKKAKIHSKGVYPLGEGMLLDYPTFERLLRHIMKRICGTRVIKPRVALCLPDNLTNVEQRAAREAALAVGAQRVEIVSKILAASFGLGMKPDDSQGRLIIHFGGGCTIVSFISSGSVILSEKSTLSGSRINDLIFRYIRDKYSIIISEEMSESIKNNLGCFFPRDYNLKMNITGKHAANGTTAYLTVDSNEIYGVMKSTVDDFLQVLAEVLIKVPACFSDMILKNGIVLTGGGSMMYGIDKLISKNFGIRTEADRNAERSVADGLRIMVSSGNIFKET